ncbi:LLM class flavin-dependent oxidoreductase [Alkalihalobacillus sp. 1P02AB]|uniref:LLM class flavin-dependent oxidoreductase n=1 Tax=Alkalihalobacillus sp. 1P02AB TaxID=3132260 RepID=UPI0039A6855F
MESTKTLQDIRLSVLDLVPILEGKTVQEAFQSSVTLAKKAEELGFHRFWVAEHHNMPGIGSSATSVVIGHIAGQTTSIRVGAGGIMLPNHSSLMVAEQFGTLDAIYPGRIDLGLGRAPGSDQQTMRAVRRGLGTTGDEFPDQLEELRQYFDPKRSPFPPAVRAYPGEGQNIPIWLLGSSGFSAKLAAELGLPFAFASHFSPEFTLPALDIYRSNFKPSDVLDKPYVMVGKNVIAAKTNEEAKFLATSMDQQFLSLIRGRPARLLPPNEDLTDHLTIHERAALDKRGESTIAGDKEFIQKELQSFLTETDADEIIINSMIYDEDARLRSFKSIAEVSKVKHS